MLNVVTIKIMRILRKCQRGATGSSTFVLYPKVVSGDTIGFQEEQYLRKE